MASKKDYVAIAEIINTGRRVNGDGLGFDALCAVAWELSDLYARDNERFDRARFLRACGFEVLASIEDQVAVTE